MSMSDKKLQLHIESMPNELTPSRDLWSGIEKAIAQADVQQTSDSGNNKVPMHLAWAASVVAAVLLTWYGVGLQPAGVTTDLSLVASINKDFNQQKNLMLASFGTPDPAQLPPAMQAELTQLAQARASIEAALKTDEENTDLINLLQWTQQQELELLKRLYSPVLQTI